MAIPARLWDHWSAHAMHGTYVHMYVRAYVHVYVRTYEPEEFHGRQLAASSEYVHTSVYLPTDIPTMMGGGMVLPASWLVHPWHGILVLEYVRVYVRTVHAHVHADEHVLAVARRDSC